MSEQALFQSMVILMDRFVVIAVALLLAAAPLAGQTRSDERAGGGLQLRG